MDVTIRTADPDAVVAAEVASALEQAGYYVGRVTVIDRRNGQVTDVTE